ncbi:hypothetical protein N2152v2_011098 [Parachlorella kessleri]
MEDYSEKPVEGPVAAAVKPKRLGFVTLDTSHCAHALKIRHRFSLNEWLRVEIGLDEDLNGKTLHGSRPWCSLQFQLDDLRSKQCFLELNNDHVSLNKHWDLRLQKVSVGLDTRVGVTSTGHAFTKVGVSNVPLMLVSAAVLLYLKHPIHLHQREAGGLYLDLPLPFPTAPRRRPYLLHEGLEMDASLRRHGWGLSLDVRELSGVIQLRQGRAKAA